MTLRLHVSPHHPEAHQKPPIFKDHAGDDGMHGPLMRLEAVEMVGIEGEGFPPILQNDPGSIHDHSGTEMQKDAADEGDGISVLVDGGHVHGFRTTRIRGERQREERPGPSGSFL